MNESTINCPKCGASLKGDSLFCNYCGTAITDIRDLLKKEAETKLEKERIDKEKEKLDKELQIRMAIHKAEKTRYITGTIAMVLGLGLILFMCIMASR